ncbi:MAG: glutamate-5-semialdehyde dehydrogenase [Fidelibacterota bacterium]|nr:MAG: glutamate-5-semialdehyde dehydrogenase [Candidatus Neomarinimicrobiota bacterium]
MNSTSYVRTLGHRAKVAAAVLGTTPTATKNDALLHLAGLLRENTAAVLAANRQDLEAAKGQGLSDAIIDRLTLTPERLNGLAAGVEEIVALPDPVGEINGLSLRPNGLQVGRMRIPLGVLAFIFESRPNVTIDAAALCLKSGNAVILRGGKEALASNLAFAGLIAEALESAGLPTNAVQVVNTPDRTVVQELLALDEYIDLLIPRGGEGLIRHVAENSRIPVIKHYQGVCHVYVDESADVEMALSIALNSKVQRPGVCNAAETLLVHRSVAADFLPPFIDACAAHAVELRGCPETVRFDSARIQPATDADWGTEYLDLILSVKVVAAYDEALDHIRLYGSDHTEAIITENYSTAQDFIRSVPSSLVLVNASTRFNDGGQLGLGAEIGISTTRLHAYGPMGLRELTIEKYIAYGEGQIRE